MPTRFESNYSSCVQVIAVKVYVAAVEVAQDKQKTGWNSASYKNWWFSEFHPPFLSMLMYFLQGSFESHPKYDKTQGSGAVFSFLYG
jgi:hypothetical protein